MQVGLSAQQIKCWGRNPNLLITQKMSEDFYNLIKNDLIKVL